MTRRTMVRLMTATTIAAAVGAASWAGNPNPSGPTELAVPGWQHADAIDAAVAKYNLKYQVPGLAVVVSKGPAELYAKGFGFADKEKGVHATADTIFRLASVSKAVSGVLAMEAKQHNQLDLDKKVRFYLPRLPAHHTYTVKQILSHQSGVRHYTNGVKVAPPPWFKEPADGQYDTAAEAMWLFANDPLVMVPGDHSSYSTHAFTILAAALGHSVNKPFSSYAAARFASWGLSTLRPEMPGVRPGRAQIYKLQNGANIVSERDNISWKHAGGGMEASAREMTKLGRKLLDGDILSAANLGAMWTKQNSATGLTNTGLGWSIGTQNGKKIVAKNGSQNGAQSYWLIYPDQKVVVTVLSNREDHDPAGLAKYVGSVAVLPPGGNPGVYTP